MMSDFVEVEEEFEEEAEEEEEGQDERKKEPKKKVPLFKLQAKNSKNVSLHFDVIEQTLDQGPWWHMLMPQYVSDNSHFYNVSAQYFKTIRFRRIRSIPFHFLNFYLILMLCF